jgi:CheY-like chemotaxis protein
MEIKKVLLIDDDEDSNFLNSWIIRNEITTDILIEQSAAKAIAYLSMNAGEKLALPDLILLDIRMPIMDGFAFLEEYNKLPLSVHEKCRVVILTSSFDNADYDRALSNPHVAGFFNKPLLVEHFMKLSVSSV